MQYYFCFLRKICESLLVSAALWCLAMSMAQGPSESAAQDSFENYDEAEKAYQKAIELDSEDAWVWMHFGSLLHDIKRYKEAEKAYRRAIELDKDYPCTWVYLGNLLSRETDRYQEAVVAYQSATRLPKECAWAWGCFAILLHEKLGRYEEAEEAYRKAIENMSCESPGVWRGLISLLYKDMKRPVEAMEVVKKYVGDIKRVKKSVDNATNLFVELAAGGFGREALEVLQGSPSAEILEPLVVGLRLFVGEDVKVAVEIMEVGKDVVKRIEELREKMNKT